MVSVRSARVRPTRRRNLRLVEAAVADASGPMKAVWFNQAYLAERLRPGTRLLLNGKLDRSGFRVATHEIVSGGRAGVGRPACTRPGSSPSTTRARRLSANRLREWIWQAVERAGDAIESLPAELRARRGFGGEADALRCAHFPDSAEQAAAARDRLAFEELCLHQARAGDAPRAPPRRRAPASRSSRPGELVARWLDSLPFEPTGDQRRAFDEIDADLAARAPDAAAADGRGGIGQDGGRRVRDAARARGRPPGGDDGADRDARRAARDTLDSLLAGEAIPFALLTGATPAARRRETLDRLASGELGLVVGTHALIEPDVGFARLAVCVVDEQHRFGVRQRAALDAKGRARLAPARPAHDRDPDPAHALADRLRRPRHDDDPRAARRAAAGEDLGRRRGEARRRLRVHPRPPARGPPGLRRLPAGRRLGEAAGEGGERRGRAAARGRAAPSSGSACCTARCRRRRRRRRWRSSSPAAPTCWSRRP